VQGARYHEQDLSNQRCYLFLTRSVVRFPPTWPLAGWSAKTTAAGATFYENHITKSTTWDRPVAPATFPETVPANRSQASGGASVNSSVGSGVSAAEAPLPPGTLALALVVVVAVGGGGGGGIERCRCRSSSWTRHLPPSAATCLCHVQTTTRRSMPLSKPIRPNLGFLAL